MKLNKNDIIHETNSFAEFISQVTKTSGKLIQTQILLTSTGSSIPFLNKTWNTFHESKSTGTITKKGIRYHTTEYTIRKLNKKQKEELNSILTAYKL